MKYFEKISQSVFLIGVILSFSLFSCSDKKNDAPAQESHASAHVLIGNGIEFDFQGDKTTAISAFENKLGIGFLDTEKGISIYLSIHAPKGLAEGTFPLQVKEAIKTGSSSALTLNAVKTDLFSEDFDTKRDLDGDLWNDGTGEITISSLKGNSVIGTFSAVAYAASGHEAQITNGKFNVEVNHEFKNKK